MGEVHQIIYIISQQFISKQLTEATFFIGLALFLLSAAVTPLYAHSSFLKSRCSCLSDFCLQKQACYWGLVSILWFAVSLNARSARFFIQRQKKPELVLF